MARTHRRFIIVSQNLGLTPSQRQQYLEIAREEAGELGVRIGDLRIGHHHLEFDMFASASVLSEALKRLEKKFGHIMYLRNLDAPPVHKVDALIEAVRLFNSQRYWETHEVLEFLWRNAHGEERRLLQSLILLAAAFVHTQKGREQVALGILVRAGKLLDQVKVRTPHVDLNMLKEAVKERLNKTSLTPFQIQLEGSTGKVENLITLY